MANLAVGFDPGKTTGIAVCHLDDKGKFDGWLTVTQVGLTDIPDWFVTFDREHQDDTISLVVYERFVTYRNMALRQVGSNQPASQVIGMIKMWCNQHKIKPEEQPADILDVAARWSGFKQPSNHAESHRYDALNHLFYWLVQNERAKPKVESFKERFGG